MHRVKKRQLRKFECETRFDFDENIIIRKKKRIDSYSNFANSNNVENKIDHENVNVEIKKTFIMIIFKIKN